jgi:hypothetical protein
MGDELTAYMYGELPQGAVESVESHLAVCSDCADDFAEIAFARYSVYEWNREEFAHLAPPVVSIDYSHNRGWMAALRDVFRPVQGFAYGALGAVIIASFLAISYFNAVESESDLLSASADKGQNEVSVVAVRKDTASPDRPAASVPGKGESEVSDVRTEGVPPKSVRATYAQPKKTTPRRRSNDLPPPSMEPQSPRLNDFDDDGIQGLRLADLVVELESE